MPDPIIFAVGSFVTLLLAGGLLLTIFEVKRIDAANATKRGPGSRRLPFETDV